MRKISTFQALPTNNLIPPALDNSYNNGKARDQSVIMITARFGLSSKTVIQDVLELSREAVNKLINKMKKRSLLLTQTTFGNTDNQFFILTSEGIRRAEYLLGTELQLKADLSKVNERNLVHDLCTQLVMLDLIKSQQIDSMVTERELRLCLDHKGNDQRIVDGLVRKKQQWIAVEMETGNSKNKQRQQVRKPILDKYLQQINLDNGMYQRVELYSHRHRFLTQIEKANKQLIEMPSNNFTVAQKELVITRLNYKAAQCSKLFELLYNSERRLTDTSADKVDKDLYHKKLDELKALAKSTQDRVIQIRLDGFEEAGKVLGLI
ncbi:hypothetical protein SOPP22_16415 [Shewanella sp. OPT22]|nr:hypothetical protein SOPP22_16415 [Shewanella sp. OPT22]